MKIVDYKTKKEKSPQDQVTDMPNGQLSSNQINKNGV